MPLIKPVLVEAGEQISDAEPVFGFFDLISNH
jgi:hypothetical protein